MQELSNFCCPPAKPGVYLKEIIIPTITTFNFDYYICKGDYFNLIERDYNITIDEVILPDDFIILEEKSVHKFKIKLSRKFYILPESPGRYQLYLAYSSHMENFMDITKIWVGKLRSNTIQFTIID